MLTNNLLVTAVHNSCEQLPLLKMWLNNPQHMFACVNIYIGFMFSILLN